jgi:hypothetical protein
MVAAHGVERYGDWSSHMVPLPKGKTLLSQPKWLDEPPEVAPNIPK